MSVLALPFLIAAFFNGPFRNFLLDDTGSGCGKTV